MLLSTTLKRTIAPTMNWRSEDMFVAAFDVFDSMLFRYLKIDTGYDQNRQIQFFNFLGLR